MTLGTLTILVVFAAFDCRVQRSEIFIGATSGV